MLRCGAKVRASILRKTSPVTMLVLFCDAVSLNSTGVGPLPLCAGSGSPAGRPKAAARQGGRVVRRGGKPHGTTWDSRLRLSLRQLTEVFQRHLIV